MRNKYAELFKEITPQKWKEICNECLTNKKLQEYFNDPIPASVIKYYSDKFGYKCPLNSHSKDERGNKYGKLTVESYAGHNNRGEALWNCRCECGALEVRIGSELRRGRHKNNMCASCSKIDMSKRRLKDLTGQTFNSLYVEKRVGSEAASGLAIYQCLCLNCGNKVNVNSGNLKNGQISCGCINSSGEYKITKILQELNVNFIKQYKIKECRNILPLPFDFAIFNNKENLCCLIEFQGRQHYFKTTGSWVETEEDFQNRLKRDEIKRTYCKDNNIPLIEISYREIDKLSVEYIKNLLQLYIDFE